MIGLMLTVLVAAVDPAASTKAPPPPAPLPQKSPVQTARDNLEQAQQIYTQSCGDRAYGAYDDLCEQLSIQIRQYHVSLDKLERAAAAAKPVPARPVAESPPHPKS